MKPPKINKPGSFLMAELRAISRHFKKPLIAESTNIKLPFPKTKLSPDIAFADRITQ